MEVRHGGDWAGFQARYGRAPLDFSANISPLGLPEGVRRAAAAALEEADRYPDPRCRVLRAKLGERHRLSPEHILCGNGAADLIFRLALAKRPRRALVTAPTFGEYERALETVGAAVERFTLSPAEDFRVTESLLGAITPGLDLLILCEPNNPTGQATDRALLLEILEELSRMERRRLSERRLPEAAGADGIRINRALKLIHSRVDRGETPLLSEAAAAAGLSTSAFSRYFARTAGRTFMTYVMELRVGKAAAMLFAYAGISAVYADVLSEAAARALRRYGITYSYRTPAPYIVDRSGTGRCPMETAVLHTEDCAVAYEILKERLAAMRARHK